MREIMIYVWKKWVRERGWGGLPYGGEKGSRFCGCEWDDGDVVECKLWDGGRGCCNERRGRGLGWGGADVALVVEFVQRDA